MGLNPIGNPNWAKETADLVERLVTSVRDKTTKPIVLLARGLVFGLLGAIVGLVSLMLVIIVSLRLLQMLWALPFDHDSSVWISYLTIGGIFVLAGWLAMSRRHVRDEQI
jgi:predicted lysophospholipase L1 biosynthesis ABC-type transport system permease subunit